MTDYRLAAGHLPVVVLEADDTNIITRWHRNLSGSKLWMPATSNKLQMGSRRGLTLGGRLRALGDPQISPLSLILNNAMSAYINTGIFTEGEDVLVTGKSFDQGRNQWYYYQATAQRPEMTEDSQDFETFGNLAIPTYRIKFHDASILAYPDSFSALMLSTNPLMYIAANDIAGTAASESVNGWNGTYTGGVTINAANFVDGVTPVAQFDGIDDYIDLDTNANFSTYFPWAAGSIVFWFKDYASTVLGSSSAKDLLRIVGAGGDLIHVQHTAANAIELTASFTGNNYAVSHSYGAGDTDWHSIGIKWADNDLIALYWDGLLVDSDDTVAHTMTAGATVSAALFGDVNFPNLQGGQWALFNSALPDNYFKGIYQNTITGLTA